MYRSFDWVWSLPPLRWSSLHLCLSAVTPHAHTPDSKPVNQTLTRSPEFKRLWICCLKLMDICLCVSDCTRQSNVAQVIWVRPPTFKIKAYNTFKIMSLKIHQSSKMRSLLLVRNTKKATMAHRNVTLRSNLIKTHLIKTHKSPIDTSDLNPTESL